MLNVTEKEEIKLTSLQKYESLCKKLSLENTLDYEKTFAFAESEMSGISVEDEVDCYEFVQNDVEPKKTLISENSTKFIRIIENKGSSVSNEKAIVFLKVQTVLNHVFVKIGLNKNDTSYLTSLFYSDNAKGCDEFFQSGPTNNANERKGLSEMTLWKIKTKYVLEPLNRVDLCYDKAGSSSTRCSK